MTSLQPAAVPTLVPVAAAVPAHVVPVPVAAAPAPAAAVIAPVVPVPVAAQPTPVPVAAAPAPAAAPVVPVPAPVAVQPTPVPAPVAADPIDTKMSELLHLADETDRIMAEKLDTTVSGLQSVDPEVLACVVATTAVMPEGTTKIGDADEMIRRDPNTLILAFGQAAQNATLEAATARLGEANALREAGTAKAKLAAQAEALDMVTARYKKLSTDLLSLNSRGNSGVAPTTTRVVEPAPQPPAPKRRRVADGIVGRGPDGRRVAITRYN
jgi:hypothetical protein